MNISQAESPRQVQINAHVAPRDVLNALCAYANRSTDDELVEAFTADDIEQLQSLTRMISQAHGNSRLFPDIAPVIPHTPTTSTIFGRSDDQ